MKGSPLVPRDPLPPLTAAWIEVGGVRLYHRVDTSAGPGAAALVYLHGFGISGTYLEPTAIKLLDRARAFIPDRPGTGRSERPPKSLDIDGAVAVLVAYLDRLGIDEATFVGNSLGCVHLIELAVRHPDRVSGLVLISPAGGPNNQPLGRAIGQLALDGVREPPSMSLLATRDYLRFGVVQSWRLFGAMARYPVLDRLEELEVPTLVIIGRRDPLVDEGRLRTVFDRRAGVAAVTVSGAHALNYTHPDPVAASIGAFLDGAALDGFAGDGVESVDVLFDRR